MNNTAPSGVTDAATTPPLSRPPANTRLRLFLRPFSSTFAHVRRRPGRTLGVVALLLLIAAAAGATGYFLLSNYHLNAARRALARGHNMEAIEHLRFCHKYRPEHPAVILLSARVARRGGAWNEAEMLLDHYSDAHGDDNDLALERLALRANRGEIEAVAPLLEAHIASGDSSSAVALEALAAGYLYRYRLNEAERHIARWLEREPESTMALLAKGKLYEQREQNSEAVMTYRHALELDPAFDEVRLRLTTNLLRFSQGEDALAHLQYLHRRLPDHPQVQVELAKALEADGRTDQAIAILDECLRDNPDHVGALSERGRIARVRGDNARAEELLYRATRLDPGHGSARYQYYLTLTQNGKPDEAAKELEALQRIEADVERVKHILFGPLQERPNDPAVPHEVAMIALRAGRPQEALRWLQNALHVDPDHVPTHRALAALYHETGNPILSSKHRAIAQRLSSK